LVEQRTVNPRVVGSSPTAGANFPTRFSHPPSAKQNVGRSSLRKERVIPLAQLPDSRRAILTQLKNRGIATISQLAAELKLTGEAVRQQLLQLQRDGWVANETPKGEPRRTGRPASVFKLTAAGDHLFPKSYDELAASLLAVASEPEPLRRMADAKVAAVEPALHDLPLPAKVDALKTLYSADDAYMSVEATGDGYLLVERNCPYYNVAMANESICGVSVDVLTRVLGVRVAREEAFQRGDGRCAFHIFANQPVKSS
jgi:predicted ArsR family transcriptional regulator